MRKYCFAKSYGSPWVHITIDCHWYFSSTSSKNQHTLSLQWTNDSPTSQRGVSVNRLSGVHDSLHGVLSRFPTSSSLIRSSICGVIWRSSHNGAIVCRQRKKGELYTTSIVLLEKKLIKSWACFWPSAVRGYLSTPSRMMNLKNIFLRFTMSNNDNFSFHMIYI